MRLFIAIELSDEMKTALVEAQNAMYDRGVRGSFSPEENLHLTLAFIGEWPEDVTACLPPVGEPFALTLSHIGVFQRAKVLWAGVEPCPALDALAARARQNLQAAGIPFDPQPFNPHITLIRKPVLPDAALLGTIRPQPAAMTVGETCLYRSERTENGMAYTVIGKMTTEGVQKCGH